MDADLERLQLLAIAVAIGFVIGFERDWRREEEERAQSFAGARTFAFAALVGGLAGFIDAGIVVALGLFAVAALAVAAYWAKARIDPDSGGTTEVALVATYLLGVTATRGDPLLAAIAGAAMAILLALKPAVTRLAGAMAPKEMQAALRFLAISVIALPLLPDRGMGPYGALNPQGIWWMVVLISGLSFLGYWLTKLQGARGILLTGIVGGLASSTATTLSLSRMVRDKSASARAGAAGIVAANVVMLARVAALLFAVGAPVLAAVWPALAAGAVVGAAIAVFYWRGDKTAPGEMRLGNPMELAPALVFAGLLAVIALASRFAKETFGESGLYVVAMVSGLADVDALTLTAAAQASSGAIESETAGVAVLLAVGANIVVKAGMTLSIAGRGAGLRVAAAFLAILAASGAGLAVSALF